VAKKNRGANARRTPVPSVERFRGKKEGYQGYGKLSNGTKRKKKKIRAMKTGRGRKADEAPEVWYLL